MSEQAHTSTTQGPDSSQTGPTFRLPPQALRPFIKAYRSQEVDINTMDRWAPAWTQSFLLLNYGEIYNMMTTRGDMIRGYPATLAGIRTLPAIGTKPYVRMRTIVVEFQPLGLYAILGERIKDTVDGSLDGAQVFPGIEELIPHMENRSFTEKCSELDSFFTGLLGNRKPLQHPGLENALEVLQKPAKQRSIESILDSAGLSSRHFRRIFKQMIGISPKLYSRILRMERVLQEFHQNPDLDYLERVHGFYDQSHFIREFKRFTNVTPRRLLRAFQNANVRKVHSNLEKADPHD